MIAPYDTSAKRKNWSFTMDFWDVKLFTEWLHHQIVNLSKPYQVIQFRHETKHGPYQVEIWQKKS